MSEVLRDFPEVSFIIIIIIIIIIIAGLLCIYAQDLPRCQVERP